MWGFGTLISFNPQYSKRFKDREYLCKKFLNLVSRPGGDKQCPISGVPAFLEGAMVDDKA